MACADCNEVIPLDTMKREAVSLFYPLKFYFYRMRREIVTDESDVSTCKALFCRYNMTPK